MSENTFRHRTLAGLRLLLHVNLKASIIYLLIVSIISLTGSQMFFTDNSDVYGPMAGNLKMMLMYLSFSVLAVYGLSNFGEHLQVLLVLGLFLLFMVVGVEFYSEINQVPVDDHYRWLFLYCGLSQLGFASVGLLSRRTVQR